MRSRLWLSLLLLPLAVLPAVPADKGKGTPADQITWKKIVVDTKFRSEGVAIADVNKDGKMDVVTGEWWFEAPDWKPHAIRKDSKEDYTEGEKNVYCRSFCCWIEDYNGDGWPDLLCVGFPGQPCHWYENPQGATRYGRSTWCAPALATKRRSTPTCSAPASASSSWGTTTRKWSGWRRART